MSLELLSLALTGTATTAPADDPDEPAPGLDPAATPPLKPLERPNGGRLKPKNADDLLGGSTIQPAAAAAPAPVVPASTSSQPTFCDNFTISAGFDARAFQPTAFENEGSANILYRNDAVNVRAAFGCENSFSNSVWGWRIGAHLDHNRYRPSPSTLRDNPEIKNTPAGTEPIEAYHQNYGIGLRLGLTNQFLPWLQGVADVGFGASFWQGSALVGGLPFPVEFEGDPTLHLQAEAKLRLVPETFSPFGLEATLGARTYLNPINLYGTDTTIALKPTPEITAGLNLIAKF